MGAPNKIESPNKPPRYTKKLGKPPFPRASIVPLLQALEQEFAGVRARLLAECSS